MLLDERRKCLLLRHRANARLLPHDIVKSGGHGDNCHRRLTLLALVIGRRVGDAAGIWS